MAGETGPLLKATLILKDAFTGPMRVIGSNTAAAASGIGSSFASIKSSVFSLKAGLMGIAGGLIFNRLIGASQELREKWQKWKEEVMDSGPRQEIERFGSALGEVGIKAETVGQAIAAGLEVGVTAFANIAYGAEKVFDIIRAWGLAAGMAAEKLGDAIGNEKMRAFGEGMANMYAGQLAAQKELGTWSERLLASYDKQKASAKDSKDITTDQLDKRLAELAVLDLQDQKKAELLLIDMQLKMNAKERLRVENELANEVERFAAEQKKRQEEVNAQVAIMDSIYQQAAARDIEAMNAKLEETREIAEKVREALEGVADIVASGLINAGFSAMKGDIKAARLELRGMLEDLARYLIQQAAQNLVRQGVGMLVGAIFGGGGGGAPTTSYGSTYSGTSGYGHMPSSGGWSSGGGGWGSSMGGGGAVKSIAVKGAGTTVVNNTYISATDAQSFEQYMASKGRRAERTAYALNQREQPMDVDR
jgi:hypothetical protein